MDQSELQKFKRQLERTKEEALRRVKSAKPEDFGDDVDSDEETHETESFVNETSLAQSVRQRLVNIDHALEKFETGRYGFCERCGQEISSEVLDLIPESRWCKDCKRQSQE